MTGRQTAVNTISLVRSPRLRGILMLVYCYRNVRADDGIEKAKHSSRGTDHELTVGRS